MRFSSQYFETLTSVVEVDVESTLQDLEEIGFLHLRIRAEPAPTDGKIVVTNLFTESAVSASLIDILLSAFEEETSGGGKYGFQIVGVRILLVAINFPTNTPVVETTIRQIASRAFQRLLEAGDFKVESVST